MTSDLTDLKRPLKALADVLLPPPKISVSDWARKHFQLSSDYSAVTGSFEPRPYQIEPLDVLSPSNPAEFMVLMCAAQMMKTLTALILLAYVIDNDPGPTLIVQPSGEDAESFSKERIAPMINDNPRVAAKVVEAKSRDAGNTILQKRFRGGQVSITGAISGRGLRRRSVRYLLLDEIDGYEVTRDGEPVVLAIARTDTYSHNRKIVLCSTPTRKGTSRIAEWFEGSDQRRFFVPCPLCGFEQVLSWPNVRWGDVDGRQIDAEHAVYKCASEACGALIPHHRKIEMVERGGWVATNPDGRYPGFTISRLYQPDFSWGKIVIEKFLPAKNNPDALQGFVNNVLAEEYQGQADTPDVDKLRGRADDYTLGTIPRDALVLTAGIDVQRNWIAMSVWGWGRNRERWLVDHRILEGNTAHPQVWEELTELVRTRYQHECGATLTIRRAAIDTGDEQYNSAALYSWIRRMGPQLVMAVKGFAHGEALVGMPRNTEANVIGRQYKRGVKIWPVNVSMAKARLYALLNIPKPLQGEPFPAGWVHYPQMPEEWYLQLSAEEYRTKMIRGYRKGEWVKIRERNEALDTTNYSDAAAFNIRVHEWSEPQWQGLERFVGIDRSATAADQVIRAESPAKTAPGDSSVVPEQVRTQQPRQSTPWGRGRILGRFTF
jgi:phage terminase large subunit GpA-like protein